MQTVIPAPTLPASPTPALSPSPIGDLGSPVQQPSPSPVATTAPSQSVASTTKTDRLTRLVELLLAGAVLLGLGGAYGLYATSDRRR